MDQACFYCQLIPTLTAVVFHSFRELCYSTEYTKSNIIESVMAKYVIIHQQEQDKAVLGGKIQLAKINYLK
jgi:hypothetical protein